MPKTKISEFSSTPASNTDIDSINISEGCAPSGINDAIRELMAQLKDFQTGAVGDSFNGPVGTTTAAAGAFTTLSASGAVTLSGGTANGVAYLNGSKVVTSGSALTFNGSNTLTFDGGSASYLIGPTGEMLIGEDGSGLYIGNGAGGVPAIPILLGSNSTTYQAFKAGGGEQMRLTSTGLGIGTSSPAAKLHIKGSSNPAIYWENSSFGSATNAAFMGSAGQLIFGRTGVADWMTIDNSGNLGLGVTPSAWSSSFRALQVKNASLWSTGNDASLTANAYYDGTNYRYIGTNGATRQYHNTDGSIAWSIAPSGTAGNAITFTQAMTLDASGNWLLGSTSSPSTVWSGSRTFAYVKGNTAGNGGEVIVESNNGNQQASFFASGISGEFGLWSTKASAIVFGNSNAERARIDSSGNLLVGTTAANVNSGGHLFIAGADSNYYIGHSGSPSGAIFHAFQYNGTTIGSVTQSGTTATLFNVTSDQRLKENIQDADSASSLIDSLQVRKFDWKSDNSHQRYGFVAQELVTVAPEAVHQPLNEEDMMAVDYSKLVPMLVKEIQSLRKRLADAGI